MTAAAPAVSLDPGGRVVLIGAGKMGGALLQGWLELGLDPGLVFVLDPDPSADLRHLAHHRGVRILSDLGPEEPAALVVLAVKPQMLEEALPNAAQMLAPGGMLLSVLAGKTLETLKAGLPAGSAIVRAMPNMPAAIGRGMTVAVANSAVTPTQRATANALLSAVGDVAWIEDESLMDAVTAVSGSGPADVFLLAESLTRAAIKAGLPIEIAARLARVTVAGSGELLGRSTLGADQLRVNVTSPGGTTAAALEVLMGEEGMDALLEAAVAAAARRSRELAS
jgi:pyrroline-5-carboxylate reductase